MTPPAREPDTPPEAAGPAAPDGVQEFRRLERKFPIAPGRVEFVAAWLGHACRPARDFPVGRVTSCYYDTAEWDAYFESADGDLEKRKVRLRWYDELPGSGPVTAYLEAKEKNGFVTWKRRVALRLDAGLLAAGRFDDALPRARLEEALVAAGLFEERHFRPAVVISYERRRLVEPFTGAHVSLDSRITASAARAGGLRASAELPSAVLELKGELLELPPSMRGLRRFATLWSSHSKYALGIETLARRLGPGGPWSARRAE